MAKYKANEKFKDLKDKFFGIHKIKILEEGGELEISVPQLVPKKVLECLEEVKIKQKKGDK